ncbi:MAG: GNAT family N-acetyltransferase [Bacteroides sp.]|nr:GNAT family N-acetyltransferase [Bacteroides sp.]
MFEIVRYSVGQEATWNQFVSHSKNGTFLFDRNYMDYHSDRFEDNSLMIYRKGKLYSLLPANKIGNVLYSHQGLTYGGMIMNDKVTVAESMDMFRLLNVYLKESSFEKVIYKPVPFIYHQHPAQEDLYALFRTTNTKIIGRNISSTIIQSDKIKFIESRKSGIRKALSNGITVRQSSNLSTFWEILDTNLKNKYGVAPVHTLSEIQLLQSRFPQNIKLYMAYKDDIALGGTLLYITKQVVHTQYISASVEGKDLGVLDLLFDCLINREYTNYPYFDFGQSTEQMGNLLNESLIFQKEGFGGRGMCYDIYEYEL